MRLAQIYDPQIFFHFLTQQPMMHQYGTKYVIEYKQFFCQIVLDFLSFLLQNISSPHSDNFPPSKFFEELLLANLLKEVSLNQPIC